MSTDTLSPEVLQLLRQHLKQMVMEMFPDLVKQATPVLAEVIREMAPLLIKSTAEQIRDDNIQKQQNEKLFEEFKRLHKNTIDQHLNKRTDFYKKFLGFDWHAQLYEQYLASEDAYVPRKFRQDDYAVNNQAELDWVRKMEKERLHSECEIIKLRRSFFLQEIAKEDDQVRQLIADQKLPKEVEVIAIDRWQKISQEYMKNVETEEESKKRTTIEAHKKDEATYRAKQVERLKNKAEARGTNPGLPPRSEGPAISGTPTTQMSSEVESTLLPKIQLVVVDQPVAVNSSSRENLVNMSTLEPLEIHEEVSVEVPVEEIAEVSEEQTVATADATPEQVEGNMAIEAGSKNLNMTDNLRRSERISSTSLTKT